MPLDKTKENAAGNPTINTSMSVPLLQQAGSHELSDLSPPNAQTNKFHTKRLATLRHGDSLENDRFMYHPYILSYYEGENGEPKPRLRPKAPKQNSEDNQDMAAMSIVSLYKSGDNLDSEMYTERDSDSRPKTKPRIVIPESSIESQECETQPNHNESSHKASGNRKSESPGCRIPTIYFEDGMRSVDFVLVWDAFEDDAITEAAYQKRKVFEANLVADGLELEYVPQESNGLNFVKIHAPKEVLRRYGEILKLRMPMRKMPAFQQVQSKTNFLVEEITSQWDKLKSYVIVDTEKFPEKNQRFTAVYSRDREYLFDVDSPCFFTPAIHSRIVQFILDRKKYSDKEHDDFSFGIEKLLNESVYSAAYPLHDGDLKQPGSLRYLLYNEWTAIRKWYRYQPLDYVKDYFGVKIGLYFAWLGFYTHMLLPAAIVGFLCFVYSCVTLYNNKPSEDICNSNNTIKMCPLCNHWCNYWDLTETCTHARITYLFDNAATVFFAVFMSFWAVLFLELWKRYSAEITHRWDLTGFDIQEEHPRPQYLARLAHVKRQEVNVVTNLPEPHVPFWRLRVPITIFSFSVVMLMVTMALATVVAIVVYRMSVLFSLRVYSDTVDNSQAILFTTATAACINLFFIVIFNWFYNYVAEYLTEFELLRTQTEFDDSLTLKIYLLQFVNYYASIFYIAFFKGKFIGSPKDYEKLFGFRQEECGPGGCLLELCIQLAIIMVGKQAMNTILEMLFPLFFKWLNTIKVKTGLTKDRSCKGERPQWLKDYKLVEWGPRSLFPEYLEMVLQYGFVTIFVAAFPLAPFFALLNNVLEMRLDARKLITFYRRPVSQRVRDIGVWYRILDSIGKLSVVTNGFIIAFTSEFIPRFIYRIYVSEDYSLNGYLNYSLSYFDSRDFENESLPRADNSHVVCRYPDFREPPWSDTPYARTPTYYHILAARLAFVVIFENVVAFIIIIIKWCIPDIPGELKDRIRREAYITNEIIIKQETIRAQNGYLYPSPTLHNDVVRNLRECPATPEQWDRLLSNSLAGTDFDLMVHSSGYPENKDNQDQTPMSI
ncbi:anoctamin-4 isoform X3 [Zophobas morio]|uniref:anoctamin-4 isoform X3 n=1 Tax=Zophobas morio TaxID=2755281 RepID=UPI003082D2F1